jgi:hypothetical protein
LRLDLAAAARVRYDCRRSAGPDSWFSIDAPAAEEECSVSDAANDPSLAGGAWHLAKESWFSRVDVS